MSECEGLWVKERERERVCERESAHARDRGKGREHARARERESTCRPVTPTRGALVCGSRRGASHSSYSRAIIISKKSATRNIP